MQFPQFTPTSKSKILAEINSQTYFFTVSHITKEAARGHIYGIRLNTGSYFLSKLPGICSCEQLDNNLPLDAGMREEICTIINKIELKYYKRPSLERINNEIFNMLIKLRSRLVKPVKI